MKRDPSEVVLAIGDALRKEPTDTVLRVNDIAKASQVHWETAQRYLRLIQFVQLAIPRVRLVEAGESITIIIETNPWLDKVEPQLQATLRLFDAGAIDRRSAVVPPKGFEAGMRKAIECGFVKPIDDGRFFISRQGLDAAREAQAQLVLPFDAAFSGRLQAEDVASPETIKAAIDFITQDVVLDQLMKGLGKLFEEYQAAQRPRVDPAATALLAGAITKTNVGFPLLEALSPGDVKRSSRGRPTSA